MFALQNAKTQKYGMGRERPGCVQTSSSTLCHWDISSQTNRKKKAEVRGITDRWWGEKTRGGNYVVRPLEEIKFLFLINGNPLESLEKVINNGLALAFMETGTWLQKARIVQAVTTVISVEEQGQRRLKKERWGAFPLPFIAESLRTRKDK